MKPSTLWRNLLFIIGLCFVLDKVHFMFSDEPKWYAIFPGDFEWYAYAYGLIAQQFVISVLLYSRYSYGDLRAKTLAYMLCVFPLIEAFLLFVDDYYFEFFFSLSIISVAWFFWAYFRSYQLKPTAILSGRAYFISGKPKNIWSFYLSLFGDPTGSKGIYINGRLYGYHNDQFECRALDVDKLNVLADEIKRGTKLEEYLRTMIGTKYSIINNCLSLRLKVWWRLCQIK